MTAQEQLAKIEELERRIAELERRPLCDAQTLMRETPKVAHLQLATGIHHE